LRISEGVAEGSLIQRVEPVVPGDAIPQGNVVVVLAATIDKQGKIESLKALKGHPLLIAAAIDAVRQWTYKPFLLNGEPVAVETTVAVSFHR
jgi:protein TonB